MSSSCVCGTGERLGGLDGHDRFSCPAGRSGEAIGRDVSAETCTRKAARASDRVRPVACVTARIEA